MLLDVNVVRGRIQAKRDEHEELLRDEDVSPEWRLDSDLLALEQVFHFKVISLVLSQLVKEALPLEFEHGLFLLFLQRLLVLFHSTLSPINVAHDHVIDV